MKEITLQEMKEIQLRILNEVVCFCNYEKIEYFLCAGSMLGAVRHKGFIPWDDDIDIAMSRPNYEKFLKQFTSEHYRVAYFLPKRSYLLPFAKIYDKRTSLTENYDLGDDIGVNIDLFPIDGLPKGKFAINLHIAKLLFLRGFIVGSIIKDCSQRTIIKQIIIKAIKTILKILPLEKKILTIINKEATRYPYKCSDKSACVVWGYGKREVMKNDCFEPTIRVSFENIIVKIPANFDNYLSSIYDNYMQPPPENMRVAPHNARAYWT